MWNVIFLYIPFDIMKNVTKKPKSTENETDHDL